MREGKGSWDRAAGRGQLRWDNNGRTVMTVKLGYDIWDMTSAMTLDRQPGQVRLDRSP
jgi:hypothetical protein